MEGVLGKMREEREVSLRKRASKVGKSMPY